MRVRQQSVIGSEWTELNDSPDSTNWNKTETKELKRFTAFLLCLIKCATAVWHESLFYFRFISTVRASKFIPEAVTASRLIDTAKTKNTGENRTVYNSINRSNRTYRTEQDIPTLGILWHSYDTRSVNEQHTGRNWAAKKDRMPEI